MSPGSGRHYPSWLTPFNGELYFSGKSPDGTEWGRLYKTDGQEVTEMPEPNPGEVPYRGPEFLTPLGEVLYFRSRTAGRWELFEADGATATGLGIELVVYFHNAIPRRPVLVPFGNELFYAGCGPNGCELYKTDGNDVTELADINPGPKSSNPTELTEFGELFFSADGPNGYQLYKTDGQTVIEVADISPGFRTIGEPYDSYPRDSPSLRVNSTSSPQTSSARIVYRTDGVAVTEVA